MVKVRTTGRIAVLATFAVLATSAIGTAAASATTKTLQWLVTYPLISNEVPLTTVVHGDYPATAARGSTVTVPLSDDVNAGVEITEGLLLLSAPDAAGTISGGRTVTYRDGTSQDVPFQLTIPKTPTPPSGTPFTFTATGALTFTVPSGAPTGQATVRVRPAAGAHIVTKSDLGEFDTPARLDPVAVQDVVVGTITIT
ncbi:hypothetical protein [Amycolatopsis sp. CA-230715]|uniref:hypothetical protein n=1 Tax=Amycolatopsis sp. CA-230715 TaxID=2745196 RepID=UPI001C018159|nr:hypothetical protein [Amycolatopsis sp. CA-230715]